MMQPSLLLNLNKLSTICPLNDGQQFQGENNKWNTGWNDGMLGSDNG